MPLQVDKNYNLGTEFAVVDFPCGMIRYKGKSRGRIRRPEIFSTASNNALSLIDKTKVGR